MRNKEMGDNMKGIILEIYRGLREIRDNLLMDIFGLFCKREKAILFDNFCGNGYGDNPKYINEELNRRNCKVKRYWVVKKNLQKAILKEFPDDIIPVTYRSISYFKAAAVSKVWIRNSRMPIAIKKRQNQFYINTWHSIIPWKKVEFDVKREKTSNVSRMSLKDNANTDLMVASCEFKEQLLRTSYRYTGDVLRAVIPRCDCLRNLDFGRICAIKNKLGIPINTHVVMYAPTFRDSHRTDIYSVDYDKVLNALEKRFGKEWVVIIRLHPLMISYSDQIKYSEKIINVTAFSDAQELLMISDSLITDYSSIMFDFMLTQKPIFLYATDVEEYRAERDFYYEITELPFGLSDCNETLEKAILEFDENKFHKMLEIYSKKIGLFESDVSSSKIIADIIEKKLD